jgi:phosphoribosylformimino-5-aminoimidazole carboxamide ribotide isomerase
LEGTASPIFNEDAIVMARAMVDAGSEAIFINDLGVTAVGANENLPIIRAMKELDAKIFVGGTFRAPQVIEPYKDLEVDLVVLDALAYQQPQLVTEAAKIYPERIAVHIDVRGGKVTIPGWTVAANKTDLDYVERFGQQGVSTIFYSNMSPDEKTSIDNMNGIMMFCKKANMSVYCTNELYELADLEKFATLGAPRLEGLILGRSLYQGRIDLKGGNAYVADLSLDRGNEPTLQDQ